MVQPWSVTGVLNAKPGIDGTTTENASSALPPWATGSVRGPIMSRKSTNDPGYVWSSSSGVAPASVDGTWMKWIVWSSISVR